MSTTIYLAAEQSVVVIFINEYLVCGRPLTVQRKLGGQWELVFTEEEDPQAIQDFINEFLASTGLEGRVTGFTVKE